MSVRTHLGNRNVRLLLPDYKFPDRVSLSAMSRLPGILLGQSFLQWYCPGQLWHGVRGGWL